MITHGTYYRAEIRRNGRCIAKMDGKYNTKEQLDAWLKKKWPGNLKYRAVATGATRLELTVWRYWGPRLDKVIINAQMEG